MIEGAIAELLTYAVGGAKYAHLAPRVYECVQRESEKHKVSVLLALSVMKTERGIIGARSRNNDGSYDLGPMQVNTIHLSELSRITGIPQSGIQQSLVYDACANVSTGIWLLRRSIDRAGDVWGGIAQYHSRTKSKGHPYAWRVYSAMQGIVSKTSQQKIAETLMPNKELAYTFNSDYRVSYGSQTQVNENR